MVDRTFQPPLDAQNSTENLSQIKINGLRHINSNSSITIKWSPLRKWQTLSDYKIAHEKLLQ